VNESADSASLCAANIEEGRWPLVRVAGSSLGFAVAGLQSNDAVREPAGDGSDGADAGPHGYDGSDDDAVTTARSLVASRRVQHAFVKFARTVGIRRRRLSFGERQLVALPRARC
jgi:hypothetical protein